MPEIHKHKGKHYSRTATGGCLACAFGSENGLGLCADGTAPKFTKAPKSNPCFGIIGPAWEEVVAPTQPKEPKMPEKPKPRPCPPPAPPKAEPSLYKAIRERLEAKDRETLHARTQKAVEAVESLLEGAQPVEERTIQNPAPAVPWSLDGLVVDPGEKAVGEFGLFWDGERSVVVLGYCSRLIRGQFSLTYYAEDYGGYAHFASLPNFPGAELLKRTTGYEAT